jgi:hypothetical protein
MVRSSDMLPGHDSEFEISDVSAQLTYRDGPPDSTNAYDDEAFRADINSVDAAGEYSATHFVFAGADCTFF